MLVPSSYCSLLGMRAESVFAFCGDRSKRLRERTVVTLEASVDAPGGVAGPREQLARTVTSCEGPLTSRRSLLRALASHL
jgi:hypothetical protein